MMLVSFCPFLVLFTLAIGSAAPVRGQCKGDTECLPGYYCFIETGWCAPCTDCEVYNRNKSWRSCAKGPTECGTCLSGFEEDILAGGRLRDWCIKSPLQASAHHSNAVQTTQNYLSWPLGIGFFIILTLFYAVCWKNWKGGNFNRLAVQSEEPPPYSSLDLPSATNDISSSSSSSAACNEGAGCCHVDANVSRPAAAASTPQQIFFNLQQSKEQPLQQAVPFRYPEDSLQLSSNPLLDSDDEADDADEESLVEDLAETLSQDRNIELEDETTMPSDWTPYPCLSANNEEVTHEDGCDNVDAGTGESVSEPPAKKRKEDETVSSPEPAPSPETADQ